MLISTKIKPGSAVAVPSTNNTMISPDLLAILCCPETKADLVLVDNRLISTDSESRRAYTIVDDIPVLLIDESEILTKEEWEKLMKKAGK